MIRSTCPVTGCTASGTRVVGTDAGVAVLCDRCADVIVGSGRAMWLDVATSTVED